MTTQERLREAQISLFVAELLCDWEPGRAIEFGEIRLEALPFWRLKLSGAGVVQEWVLCLPYPDLGALAATRAAVTARN